MLRNILESTSLLYSQIFSRYLELIKNPLSVVYWKYEYIPVFFFFSSDLPKQVDNISRRQLSTTCMQSFVHREVFG